MRFAANENVSGTVIRELRAKGNDVWAAKESMAGASDQAILAQAQTEQRIVLTHDKDFGELAFRYGLPATCGVILIRLAGADSAADNQQVLAVIESRSDWNGHFTVVECGRVRMRPLPSRPSPPAKPK